MIFSARTSAGIVMTKFGSRTCMKLGTGRIVNSSAVSPIYIWYMHVYIWVRSRSCDCLVTWFSYQIIAKPGNKTAAPSWPDTYIYGIYIYIWYLSFAVTVPADALAPKGARTSAITVLPEESNTFSPNLIIKVLFFSDHWIIFKMTDEI